MTAAAALLADPARTAMLWSLADGRPLPAGELARAGGVSASTASAHLNRLIAAGWVAAERHGRHRYIRLINADVAALLEALALAGGTNGARSVRPGPAPELRLARSCYDHLAGRAGVALTGALLADGTLTQEGRIFEVSAAGRGRLAELGIDIAAVEREARERGRFLARACLDWSERQDHLAGALGQALLERVLALAWFERKRGSRDLRLTNAGRRALSREFGVRLF
ncbi:MAG TPA: winged helix-turn-helix domain-containing protein [Gemmatimonadales bacterium]|nr:winged helix-turn-helix domain-containing protein [Gemmatimonadales bacterium]